MAYSRKYEPESESSDKDMTNEQLVASYRLLFTKWEEAFMEVEQATTITNLEEIVALLSSKLENVSTMFYGLA